MYLFFFLLSFSFIESMAAVERFDLFRFCCLVVSDKLTDAPFWLRGETQRDMAFDWLSFGPTANDCEPMKLAALIVTCFKLEPTKRMRTDGISSADSLEMGTTFSLSFKQRERRNGSAEWKSRMEDTRNWWKDVARERLIICLATAIVCSVTHWLQRSTRCPFTIESIGNHLVMINEWNQPCGINSIPVQLVLELCQLGVRFCSWSGNDLQNFQLAQRNSISNFS